MTNPAPMVVSLADHDLTIREFTFDQVAVVVEIITPMVHDIIGPVPIDFLAMFRQRSEQLQALLALSTGEKLEAIRALPLLKGVEAIGKLFQVNAAFFAQLPQLLHVAVKFANASVSKTVN